MAHEIDLSGKRALVTGASDGVGAGVARVLARAGCRVAGSGRVAPDHPRAVELLQSLRVEGGEATYLCGDLADSATPARLVDEAVTAMGGLDILVSNAGRNDFHGAALAIEWGPAIRVIGVAPGFIDTPGNQAWFDSFPDPSAEHYLTDMRHPVGRIGKPDEVGNLCAFLASPLSGFITGNTILMDGGRSALMQD